MAISRIDIETFLALDNSCPVIDVRSEGEFNHAHIPSAVSIPIFNNEERKEIGTAYKQQSKQIAIKIGLHAFGRKMLSIVEATETKLKLYPPGTPVVVYCWRGGMRSAAVAWLLNTYGFTVMVLIGGYKTFRKWSIAQFNKDYRLLVLGGFTGSGKTEVLQEMITRNLLVIDLEKIAGHKGSAFGNIGLQGQPSQELFENLLALTLWKNDQLLNQSANEQNGIWIEDESQRIGQVNIPSTFFATMRKSPVYFLDIPFDQRLVHIIHGYGNAEKEKLINATLRIQKRLGNMETKNVIEQLINNNIEEGFKILLRYYDKLYLKGLHNRENLDLVLNKISCDRIDALHNAILLMTFQKQNLHA